MLKLNIMLLLLLTGAICWTKTSSINSTTSSYDYIDPYDYTDPYEEGETSGHYEENGNYVTDDEDYDIKPDEDTLFENSGERIKNIPKELWFSCDGGQLWLTKDKKCDGHPDCQDCSDEINCLETSNMFFYCYGKVDSSSSRNGTQFYSSNPFCIPRHKFCDGEVDCASGADERQTGNGFKCEVKQRHRTCLLPEEMICDDVVDCENKADVCDNSTSKMEPTTHAEPNKIQASKLFQCLNTNHNVTIFLHQVCDGIIDCPGFSDECLCEEAASENISRLCSDTCWRNIWQDEPESKACSMCSPGQVMLCDGQWEASGAGQSGSLEVEQSEDECACLPTPLLCRESPFGLSSFQRDVCSPIASQKVEFVECFGFSAEGFGSARVRMCDGRPECLFGEDECVPECDAFNKSGNGSEHFCNLLAEGLSYKCNENSSVGTSSKKIVRPCDGVWDCKGGEDEMNCPTRVSCDPGNDVTNAFDSTNTFDINQLCDGKVDCRNGMDENSTTCERLEKNVSCDSTKERTNQNQLLFCDQNLFIRSRETKNGNAMTTEGKVFKYGLLVLAVTGAAGNFLGIILAVVASYSLFNNHTATTFKLMIRFYRESTFCISVGLAKVLFSLYVAYIVLSDTSNQFICAEDGLWRTVTSCKGWGGLALVTITTPLYAMVIFITMETLVLCRKDPKSEDGSGSSFLEDSNRSRDGMTKHGWKPTLLLTSAVILFALVWLPVSVIAVLALGLSQDQGLIEMNWFVNNNPVNACDVMSLTERVVTMAGSMTLEASPFSWEYTDYIMSAYAPALGYRFVGAVGFYSHSAVCLPLFFSRPYASSHVNGAERFSFNVMLLNSAVCVYLFVLCIVRMMFCLFGSKSEDLSTDKPISNKFSSHGCSVGYTMIELVTWVPILVTYFFNPMTSGPSANDVHQMIILLAVALNCGVISPLFQIYTRKAAWLSCCSPGDEDCVDGEEESNSMIKDYPHVTS